MYGSQVHVQMKAKKEEKAYEFEPILAAVRHTAFRTDVFQATYLYNLQYTYFVDRLLVLLCIAFA